MIRSDDAGTALLLELVPLPVIVADRSGRVRCMNAAARTLLRAGGALLIDSGTLHARRKEEEAELQAALAGAPGPLCFRNRQGVPVYVLDIFHQPDGEVVLRIADLVSLMPLSPARLGAVFGFTAAEARVAAAFTAGRSLPEIAEQHGVMLATAQRQLKIVRAKTGARSQAHLMALLLFAGG